MVNGFSRIRKISQKMNLKTDCCDLTFHIPFISLQLTISSIKFQWDIMPGGGPAQLIANLAKGQDRGNSVNIQVSFFTFSFSILMTIIFIASHSLSWS